MRLSLCLALVLSACTQTESPPDAATDVEIDRDVCDWAGAGDLGVTVSDAIVTPHGIAIACEQPGATAHSLLLLDPATHAKREVYGIHAIEVAAMQLVGADTLLLEGRSNELFVVDLAATAPAPRRILAYSGGGDWMFEPRVVGNQVYVSHEHCAGTLDACTHTLERVDLHGGPDQSPVVVAELPSIGNFTIAAGSGVYVLGGNSEHERTLARVDLAAAPARVDLMLDRTESRQQVMAFHGEVAGRVLWQDQDQLVELSGTTATTIAPFACPLSYSARISGDDIVQAPWTPQDPCQDIVAMNAADGTVRRAPLENKFGETYFAIGVVGDTAWVLETDIDRTRVLASKLD